MKNILLALALFVTPAAAQYYPGSSVKAHAHRTATDGGKITNLVLLGTMTVQGANGMRADALAPALPWEGASSIDMAYKIGFASPTASNFTNTIVISTHITQAKLHEKYYTTRGGFVFAPQTTGSAFSVCYVSSPTAGSFNPGIVNCDPASALFMATNDRGAEIGAYSTFTVHGRTEFKQYPTVNGLAISTSSVSDTSRVSKLGDTMSGNLTAPAFIGALTGNAATATTATNQAGGSVAATSATIIGSGNIALIKTGASGSPTFLSYAPLIVQTADNTGIGLLSQNVSVGVVAFGDSDDNDIGRIRYNHADNTMKLYAGDTAIVDISTNVLSIAGTISASGQIISSGTGTNSIFGKTVISTDVASGQPVFEVNETGSRGIQLDGIGIRQKLTTEALYLQNGSSGGNTIMNMTSGSVGIGTAIPAAKVEIASGTIRMSGTGAPTAGYLLCLSTTTKNITTCSGVDIATGACATCP